MTARVRAWIREHRDWPKDVWLPVVIVPLALSGAYGVIERSWATFIGSLIFYTLGIMAHRVWAATARYVASRREVQRIALRDGLPPPDLP